MAAAPHRATFRSAEDLYAQLPVRDVVRVLAKTKQDAEKKREELREFVGVRHHDLIDSADAIISMNDTVAEFEKTLLTIEQAAGALLDGGNVSSSSAFAPLTVPEHQTPVPLCDERSQVDFLLRAPTLVWSALDVGDELKACHVVLRAEQTVSDLGLFASVKDYTEPTGDVFSRLEHAAKRDAASFGPEWQLKFPFLVSQARLATLDCRRDIIHTCHAAFSERHISAQRVEKAMQALILLQEVTNPTDTLLAARRVLVEEVAGEEGGNAEDRLVSITELMSRTLRDCELLRKDHGVDSQVKEWMTSFAAPLASQLAQRCCSKLGSLATLALCQRQVQDSLEGESTLFADVFADTFEKRAKYLLQVSHDATLRKVKRLLSASAASPVTHRAMRALQHIARGDQLHGFAFSDQEGSAWVEDLTTWLEQRESVASSGRFAQTLSTSSEFVISVEIKQRLARVTQTSQSTWVEHVMARLGPELEARAALLPWHQRGGSSSTMGGWVLDDTHGDLPSVPSWPCAEFCFQLSMELDDFFDEEDVEGDVKRVLGEAAWRALHTTYSSLAQNAKGADGKLQAAFDLEYASLALIGLDRPLLPFTQGGVDVYACAGALKQRARACAAASSRLMQVQSSTTTYVELGHTASPNLLSLVDPVPRFALLPVPQRARTAVSPVATREQSTKETKAAATVTTTEAPTSFGRVLGWLS